MRAMVPGAGRMGRAAAWDLARQPGVTNVRLVDRDAAALPGELAVPLGPFVSAVRARGIEVAEQWESLN